MKIGLLTAAFPTLSLEELAMWASNCGFDALEIACWPKKQEKGIYAATHIDVESLTPKKVTEIKDMLSKKKLIISSLGYYANPLHPDSDHRKHDIDHLKKVIICSATAWVVAWLGTTVTVIFLSLQYCLSIQSMLVEFRARPFTLGDFSSISDNRCGLFLPTVLGLNVIMSASFESLVRSSKEPSSALSAKDTFPANSSL